MTSSSEENNKTNIESITREIYDFIKNPKFKVQVYEEKSPSFLMYHKHGFVNPLPSSLS